MALTFGTLDERMDRIAAALQARGRRAREVIAICALPSTRYAEVFLGALSVGIVVAPLASGSTPESLARMCENAQVQMLFVDQVSAALLSQVQPTIEWVVLDTPVDSPGLQARRAAAGSRPAPVMLQPEPPFNIFYATSAGDVTQSGGPHPSSLACWMSVRCVAMASSLSR